MTDTAKSGNTVHVHYVGKRNDGTVFDSSRDRDEPLEFELGAGQVIPGFEEAVDGMELGEVRKVRIEPDNAYGERRDDLLIEVGREHVPEGVDLETGTRLQLQREGRAIPVTVTEIGDETITLDANHPLAGEELNFEIELVSVD